MAKVVGIYIAENATEPMQSVAQVKAVAGKGLVGDRYSRGKGTFSHHVGPDREITLLAVEELDHLRQTHGIELGAIELRRNVATNGIDLNGLIDKEFQVGEVVLLGIKLCEPCKHLEAMTAKPLIENFLHRAGLRAQILKSGTIRVSDEIKVLS